MMTGSIYTITMDIMEIYTNILLFTNIVNKYYFMAMAHMATFLISHSLHLLIQKATN